MTKGYLRPSGRRYQGAPMQVVRRRPDVGYIDCSLWVPKSRVNVEGLKLALTFTVADRTTISKFELWRETAHHLILPREFWDLTTIDFPVVDCRATDFQHVDIRSRILLDHLPDENGGLQPTGKDLQRRALQALLDARGGILQLACGLGKTVIFLELIARLKVPTLIVIDNTQLLEQWKKEVANLLIVPGGTGLIQGPILDWKKPIVFTTYQTLAQKADLLPEEARKWFGLIGWDEGHHIGAPTFCRSADLFYGKRIALTATPDRDDGMQVVYHHHIGKVLFKHLKQDRKPRIYFRWTGLALDKTDPVSRALTEDKNGELHVGKVAGYFGQWPARLHLILDLVTDALGEGRKVLVLSNSIDELANLKGMWDGRQDLYTDIKFPDSQEVGSGLLPLELDDRTLQKLIRNLSAYRKQVTDVSLPMAKRQMLARRISEAQNSLDRHAVWRQLDLIHRKRQREHVKSLVDTPSTAGLMIHQVPTSIRANLMKEKEVVFAVSKYGREGLDSPDLDTIIAAEPMSSRNALQQFMGRVLRKGGKSPVVVFLEDDIGPFIGMCQNLRRHLREWPEEDGGPLEYECIGHPTSFTKRGKQWTQNVVVFGR